MRCAHCRRRRKLWKLNCISRFWLYGHAVEASEPYELLANLIDISQGGLFRLMRFPPRKDGGPPSPGDKIKKLEQAAKSAGMDGVVIPMQEVWNNNLRNAIFHSDYSLHLGDVRFKKLRARKDGTLKEKVFVYKNDEIVILVNWGLAYFRALQLLRSYHIGLYTEPKEIAGDPRVLNDPNARAIVMVREGHGAIWPQGRVDCSGTSNWSPQLSCGPSYTGRDCAGGA